MYERTESGPNKVIVNFGGERIEGTILDERNGRLLIIPDVNPKQSITVEAKSPKRPLRVPSFRSF